MEITLKSGHTITLGESQPFRNTPPYPLDTECAINMMSKIEGGLRTSEVRAKQLRDQLDSGTLPSNIHPNVVTLWEGTVAHQRERLRRFLDQDFDANPTEWGLRDCWNLPDKQIKDRSIFDCNCPIEFNPVCGLDGKSYSSACMASCNGTDILKNETCSIKGPVYVLTQGGSYSAPFFMTEAQQQAMGGGNVGLQSITDEEYQQSVKNALTAYTAQGRRNANNATQTTNTTVQRGVPQSRASVVSNAPQFNLPSSSTRQTRTPQTASMAVDSVPTSYWLIGLALVGLVVVAVRS